MGMHIHHNSHDTNARENRLSKGVAYLAACPWRWHVNSTAGRAAKGRRGNWSRSCGRDVKVGTSGAGPWLRGPLRGLLVVLLVLLVLTPLLSTLVVLLGCAGLDGGSVDAA